MPRKFLLCLIIPILFLLVLLNFFLVPKAGIPLSIYKDYNYFIAANFHDSEKSLSYSLPELSKVISYLNRGDNIFISFVENGSKDNTVEILKNFEASLNVPSKFTFCKLKSVGSWRVGKILGESYSKKIFKMMPLIRYQRMAAIRNIALAPLNSGIFDNDLPIKVVFLNDIFFVAEDLLKLIATNEGKYDIACPLDFYYQFYDVLVARDVEGYWFSGFYPFIKHEESQKLLKENKPFKAKACWNGVVVMNADAFLYKNVTFRGRIYDHQLNCECIQSECLLICLDFARAGLIEIYINPDVRVSYEWKYYMLHSLPVLRSLVEIYQSFFYDFKDDGKNLGRKNDIPENFETDEEIGSKNLVGCSMPPYWNPELQIRYMDADGKKCIAESTRHKIYNKNREWEEFEKHYYKDFFKYLNDSC